MGRLRRAIGSGAIFCLAALPVLAAPQRIVSINLCTDQLALLLAPERVVAVTFLARDPAMSTMADAARAVPHVIHGTAEEVAALKPDLVLGDPFGGSTARHMLERTGFPVLTVAVPSSPAGIAAALRTVGTAVGSEGKAEELIAGMAAELAGGRRRNGERAVFLYPNAFSTGTGTLADTAMQQAGLTNVVAHGGYGALGLEQLLALAPDLLIIPRAADGFSQATALLSHPAVATRWPPERRITMDAAALTCGTPAFASAVRQLGAP